MMELTVDQALQKAIEAHKAGKTLEADRYYSSILKANPKHPDANHNMGVLAVGVGKVEASLPFFKTAIEANPNMAQYWLSYINALIKLDRMVDAKAIFDQAKSKGAKGNGFNQLEKQLDSSPSQNSNNQEPSQEQLKSLMRLYTHRRYQQALMQASQVLERFPKSVNLYNIIGASNKGLGKLDEAIEAYTKALSINPDYADAYNNMGNALKDKGKLKEAIEAYNKALSIKPNYAEAYNNTGNALRDRGMLEEAIDAYNKALSIKPNYAEAHNNMGNVLQDQGKLEEAIEAYNKATSINPDYAQAHYNLGVTLKEQGELEKAIDAYNKALSIKPDYAEAIINASSLRNQISDTALVNEEFERKLETHGLELIEMPKFQIQQAVRAFLLSDQKLVRKHLSGYNTCSPSSISKLKAKDRVFCSAYNGFLQKLIEKPFENEATFANGQTVFHLGESHCLSYAHKKIILQGIDYTVAPRIIFGAKAYHFSTEKENSYKAITKANFDSLPDSSKVFISFGEIDCRPNEGFISAVKKHKKPIENLVSDTVRGYVDWFFEQNQSKNHSLFFFNVPAPIYGKTAGKGLNKEVARTVKLFNSSLAHQVADRQFNLIDVYKFTVGNNGFSNKSFHIDNHHLSSYAIPEIEKQIGA